MAAIHFIRAFADFFPGKGASAANPQQRPPQPACAGAETAPPRVIGQGADNETIVTIGGIPNLFVDEGDCIVQFRPAFEEAPRQTQFGTKILPELVPHWSLVKEHAGALKDAIAMAIRAGSTPVVSPQSKPDEAQASAAPVQAMDTHEEPHESPRQRAPRQGGFRGDDMLAATIGRVLSWGEEEFPSRKPTGKPFYKSFAMHIATAAGERTLQGEGLKDAIAQSGCQVGDVVTVRRLEKIKVPAFTEGGRPIMKNGQQVLWDKWLWSISK